MTDILSRLPVKSLLRFRCVHKTWSSLFKSSSFIINHFKNPKKKDPSLIFVKYSEHGSVKAKFSLLTRDSFNVCLDVRVAFEPHLFCCCGVVGSCNGVVCLYNCGAGDLQGTCRIFLHNPCLKQRKIIPQPTISPPGNVILEAVGFGYDSMNNDFKVVRVLSWGNYEETNGYNIQAEVYTLGMDSWRKVELPDAKIFDYAGASLNGALHWMGFKNRMADCVVGFDVSSEVFRLFPLPDCDAAKSRDKKIDIYRNSLCVVMSVRRGPNLYYEVWAMEEYGVEKSWTRLHVFELFLYPYTSLSFFGFGMNEEFLFDSNIEGLYAYHTGKKQLKKVKFDRKVRWCEIVTYTQSLVSPNEGK